MIRLATVEDLEGIGSVVRAAIVWMQGNGIDQWDQHYPVLEQFRDDILRDQQFVMVEDGAVVGAISLDPQQPPEYAQVDWRFPGPVQVIHRLVVHPENQGKGYAKLLVKHVEQVAARLGCNAIRLDAYESNPAACRLYQRLGYRRLGKIFLGTRPFYCFEKQIQ